MNEQKRFVLAMVLSGLIMAGYYFFFAIPAQKQAERIAAEQATSQPKAEVEQVFEPKPRSELIAANRRIKIDTPSLHGSFQTTGMRFDDMELKNYKKTVKKDSPDVTLLSPDGADHGAEIFDNWTRQGGGSGLETDWAVVNGNILTPDSPIELRYDGDGFTVKRKISVDDKFLITLEDTLTNTSDHELSLVHKGASRQYGMPEELTNLYIIQEGPIAILDGVTQKIKYRSLASRKKKGKGGISEKGTAGWVGLTDRYWLTAVIPQQGETIQADLRLQRIDGQDVYEAAYTQDPMTLSAGKTVTSKGFIFVGAKQHSVLKNYMDTQGIARLDLAVDYGRLGILAKPMSWALTRLGALTGNFGVGILLLVLIVKIFLFPLNNKAYASMAKMRAVQPKLKKLQARYGDDRVKLQQETMALYKKEGVNPVAGCLPMIPQMFVFLALYKSLFITMEMRHAPFFGYLNDLSAREPISILNGFGLFPWDSIPTPALAALALGPLALLYGLTMAMMQTLNTPPADKTQARIMQFMPLFFMFIMARFASGLLLYWVWNNTLTLVQQYYITRKFKVDTPLDGFLKKLFGKSKKSADKE